MGLGPSLAMALQHPLLPKVRQCFRKLVSNLGEQEGKVRDREESGQDRIGYLGYAAMNGLQKDSFSLPDMCHCYRVCM